MRFLLIISLMVLALEPVAWAYPNTDKEYLQEIREEVFYPCHRKMMTLNGTFDLVTVRTLHSGIKAFGGDDLDVLEKILLGKVKGKSEPASHENLCARIKENVLLCKENFILKR